MALLDNLKGGGGYQLAGLLSQLPSFSGRPNVMGNLGPGLMQMGQQAREDAKRQKLTDSLRGVVGGQERSVPMQGAMAGGPGATPDQIQRTQGLLSGSPQLQQYVTGLLDAGMPGEANKVIGGLLTQQDADPTSLQRNLQSMGVMPGTEEYNQIMREYLLKPSTQVNIGDRKPLGKDVSNWRDAQGNAPDPRMTLNEAAAAGFRPVSTEQRKAEEGARQSAPAYGEMIKVGFGEDGEEPLFPPDDDSVFQRGGSTIEAWMKGVSDSDERLSLYKSSQDALVTGLARLVGQVGTLTDRDVDTVRALLPTPGRTPRGIAKAKFRQIGTLLKGQGLSDSQLKQFGFPDWALDSTESEGNGDGKPLSEMTDEELQAIINGR